MRGLNTILLIVIAGVLGFIAYRVFFPKEDPCVVMAAFERQPEYRGSGNFLLDLQAKRAGTPNDYFNPDRMPENVRKEYDEALFACRRSLNK